MPDDFVTQTIDEQGRTRTDIRTLGRAIAELCKEIAENSSLLRELLEGQRTRQEQEASLIKMSEKMADNAVAMTKLVEGMHLQNRLLTEALAGLSARLTADATVSAMIERLGGIEPGDSE